MKLRLVGLLGGAGALLLWLWSDQESAAAGGDQVPTEPDPDEDLTRATSRSLEDLEPSFGAQVEQLLEQMEGAGFPIYILETYRSAARQAYLYEQGFSQIRNGGAHELRLAADLGDGRRDSQGRLVLYGASEPAWTNAAEREEMAAEFFAELGARAQALGLEWGGAWRSFYDPAHVQSASYS